MKEIPQKVQDFHKDGGAVIVLYGESGAGKSYRALKLLKKFPNAIVLDGDSIRHFVNYDLGYSEEDRKRNNQIVANFAKMLYYQGKMVIISTVRGDLAFKHLGNEVKNKILIHVEKETSPSL